ncbi:MAG: energy-coupling factor transporter transmembrane protein EcfT [Bacilli bacterium]|nr:energy-coupling factor transporter transmembrane protein EcfT [Bacilli bacterium]
MLFLFYLSKINLLNIFRQLLNFKFLILFIFVINLLTIQKQAHVMRIFLIDKQFMPKAFFQTSKIIYRIFKMLSISNILIVTTRPQEIASSFCTLLRPLSFLKLQSENINMMITISIRYIYIFFQEINRLYKAQISRGMKNDNFFQKITIFFLIINPLFDFIFRSSNDLVFALKTRGYRINVNRTHYRQIILHKKDAITITFMAFFLLLFVIIRLLEY